ncbi:hypothetical protein QBC38DRAFT_471719 [Podospora fimiseda]|uniref:Uncharacterized protein n=1 Tax=Podospora fimiseda TaxID=252190 RepID=A0AAN7H6E9_9PEZI|nr:hypothetical protein QBC38DRAFT_471719 [Podospora fimiseda]
MHQVCVSQKIEGIYLLFLFLNIIIVFLLLEGKWECIAFEGEQKLGGKGISIIMVGYFCSHLFFMYGYQEGYTQTNEGVFFLFVKHQCNG